MDFEEQFHPDDLTSIQAGIREFETGQIEFEDDFWVTDTLMELLDYEEVPTEGWEKFQKAPPAKLEEPSVDFELDDVALPEPPPTAMAPRPSWLVGMSKEFLKAIQKVDRKLQGQILGAIAKIIANPMKLKGDTIKPLKGGPQKLWRYRIGNYRLVYHPDVENNQIVLIAFAARSGAYG